MLIMASAAGGCANLTLPGRGNPADPVYPWQHGAVAVSPARSVAPVGSEVILIGGVIAQNGRLTIDERVEWTIDPSSVGHFVTLQKRTALKWIIGPGRWPRKLSANYAVGMTSDRRHCLNRGTPTPDDDIPITMGQTWTSVTSPVEGTTHVTLFAPAVHGWDRRKQTATIRWVDAECGFPPAATIPSTTPHLLTTTVLRHTDQLPVAGWLVRYQIAGGAPAGFLPEATQVFDATTNGLGQASVEIVQSLPARGTTNVSVQVIQPAELSGDGKETVVFSGITPLTWAAPMLTFNMTGPAQAAPGATATYRIDVANQGDLATRGVVVTDQVPPGVTVLDSTPPGQLGDDGLTWQLGDLAPRTAAAIVLNLRVDRAGTFNNCARVATADGLTAERCVTTTAAAPAIDVNVIAQVEPVAVGSDVTFEIVVTNRSAAAATGLMLRDTFDAGLEHASLAGSPLRVIERELAPNVLEPGGATRIGVTFRVTQPGRLCNTVEVTGDGGLRANASACITAVPAAVPAPVDPDPPIQPSPAPAPPAGAAKLSVNVTGPAERTVGEVAEFMIELVNTGDAAATGITLTARLDAPLEPKLATEGHRRNGDRVMWSIDRLEPGESIQRQVNCESLRAAPRACNRVTAVASEGARADDMTCLIIRAPATPRPPTPTPPTPAATALRVTVSDLRDAVEAGRQVTYEIRLTNDGPQPARGVELTVTVPEEMTPVPLGTTGATRGTIRDRTVRFAPAAEIPAGTTLTYRVRTLANRAGEVTLRVEVAAPGQAAPLRAEESTTIFTR